MKTWRTTMFYGMAHLLTEEQEVYLDSIFAKQLTVVNAKAGTGKTTLAVGAAKILGKPLVYLFAPVEEDKMGFRPGTQDEKEAEYLQPLYDALLEINENPEQAIVKPEPVDGKFVNKNAWIYPCSHIFTRGTNLKGKTVIIDEAQNWTLPQLKKVMTRIHDDCHVIIIGHVGQIDLEGKRKSGFERMIEHFSDVEFAQVCTLTKNFRGRLALHADEM